MARELIDRYALIKDMYEDGYFPLTVADKATEKVMAQPTVDAVEVVHGEWIPEDVVYNGRTEKFKCSACGRVHFYGHYVRCLEYEFCPMCGAKMDGDIDG